MREWSGPASSLVCLSFPDAMGVFISFLAARSITLVQQTVSSALLARSLVRPIPRLIASELCGRTFLPDIRG